MSMNSLEVHEHAGDDGVIHLAIPTGRPGGSYRMIILWEPESAQGRKKEWPPGFLDTIGGGWTSDAVEESEEQADVRRSSTWPPGVFESIAGQWEGDFVEESEGPLQERDPL